MSGFIQTDRESHVNDALACSDGIQKSSGIEGVGGSPIEVVVDVVQERFLLLATFGLGGRTKSDQGWDS
jgi:hypothetical protein